MPRDYEYDALFLDGPVVHTFDRPGWGAWRPGRGFFHQQPTDTCKSMSPEDSCYYATEGGGANGTPRYLAQDANDADQFYAESAPTWWIPGRFYDLRDTWATMYLKEVKPVTVAPGYTCHLFIAAYMPSGLPRIGHRLCCWYLRKPLTVGKGEWAYNEVCVANDPGAWTMYTRNNPPEDTLDETLAHCGFIGWMYLNDQTTSEPYRGVHAYGTVGWDEFRYNLKPSDLDDLKASRPLANALVF